jgi:hypothetical protein
VLAQLGSKATSLDDLSGQRVCAPAGSTSLDKLKTSFPEVKVVTAATHTGCLVKFQQGQADAITGDDTVLAGLAAQDPYATVVGAPFTSEPYGIGGPRRLHGPGPVPQHRSRPDDLGRLLESLVQPMAGARARPGTNTANPGLRTLMQTQWRRCRETPGWWTLSRSPPQKIDIACQQHALLARVSRRF